MVLGIGLLAARVATYAAQAGARIVPASKAAVQTTAAGVAKTPWQTFAKVGVAGGGVGVAGAGIGGAISAVDKSIGGMIPNGNGGGGGFLIVGGLALIIIVLIIMRRK